MSNTTNHEEIEIKGRTLRKFVKKKKLEIPEFDGYDVGSVKEVVEAGLEHFGVKAKIDWVEHEYGETEVVYVETETAYRNLNRLVTHAIGDGSYATIDYLYEGHVEKAFASTVQ